MGVMVMKVLILCSVIKLCGKHQGAVRKDMDIQWIITESNLNRFTPSI